MPETAEQKSPRKPSVKVGDIVFAEALWYLVTDKAGMRCKGRIVGSKNTTEYRFTTRAVERVFRELGKSTRGSGHDDR
jgi:hypothetical protein